MTDDAPLIVGLGGTTRPGSSTERALAAALGAAEALGARTRLVGGDVLSDLPIYDPRPGGTTLTAVRSIIHAMRGWPTPFGAAMSVNSDSFGPDGRPLEPRDAWQLDTVAAQVVQFARMRFTS